MRLIDADGTIREIVWNSLSESSAAIEATAKAIHCIENMSSIDAVKHGRWIEEPNCWYRCSNCGSHYPSMLGYIDYNYCPSCGADMRERKEE